METELLKKVLSDEFDCDEKALRITFKLLMEDLTQNLSIHEIVDRFVDKFQIEPEKKKLFKDKIFAVEGTNLSYEEGLRKGAQIAKEVFLN